MAVNYGHRLKLLSDITSKTQHVLIILFLHLSPNVWLNSRSTDDVTAQKRRNADKEEGGEEKEEIVEGKKNVASERRERWLI